MLGRRWLLTGLVGIIVAGFGSQYAQAGDLKITIPRRSTLTPVQRLNREELHRVSGADGEVEEARACGMPVVFSENELREWIAKDPA